MDAHHNMLMEKVGEGILQAAQAEEQKLDAKLKALENLDEDDFEILRQKRKLEMQKKMKQQQNWIQLGHGKYDEINDTKEFFTLAKKSERLVVHFYRGVTPRCEIVDAHLIKLAQTHVETKFMKVNVEKNPFLVEKLHIIMIPTIVLIINGKTSHSIIGFDEFGGTDDFTTDDVAYVLSTHKVLNYDGDRSEEISNRLANTGLNRLRLSSNIRSSEIDNSDSD
uniref:Thioredoxin domain-containing protein n=1 Tax=Chromulina nebulosa TaxID=96789 RepID=A0A7S0SSS6_9STRA|mmetsp:Transcript_1990/g.1778  ORF Transcript_1990/g.1778 Transcript_1990/m.1778 type:complete len:223 (+) Transcript_1990:64-732(+)